MEMTGEAWSQPKFRRRDIAALTESLPRSIRSSAFGTVYSVSIAAFGGTTQLVVTWLIHVSGSAMAPAWYLLGRDPRRTGGLPAHSRERARPDKGEPFYWFGGGRSGLSKGLQEGVLFLSMMGGSPAWRWQPG